MFPHSPSRSSGRTRATTKTRYGLPFPRPPPPPPPPPSLLCAWFHLPLQFPIMVWAGNRFGRQCIGVLCVLWADFRLPPPSFLLPPSSFLLPPPSSYVFGLRAPHALRGSPRSTRRHGTMVPQCGSLRRARTPRPAQRPNPRCPGRPGVAPPARWCGNFDIILDRCLAHFPALCHHKCVVHCTLLYHVPMLMGGRRVLVIYL